MFLRKIIDIKISNNEISVLRDAKISVEELETQIKNLPYSGESKAKSEDAEKAKLPAFIQVFYYLFFKKLSIPSEIDFYNTYLEWMGGIKNGKLIYENLELDPEGVENRIKRTYPSLIRDLHFLYLLETSRQFDYVEYSMQMDYFNGLDLKISYKTKEYFVSLFIDSTRGKYFKRIKKERHDYSQIVEIEFNLDFSSLKKVGNIYLLDKSHVELLIERINSI
jgi:hypothetical protein